MKKKEEIFEAFEKICRDHDYFNHRIFVYDELKAFIDKSLTAYSDQQNKELREEKERLIAGIRRGQHLAENLKWSDDPTAEGFTANEKEIQRLTKEVEELKKQRKAEIYEAQQKIHAEYKDKEERVYQRNAKVEIELTRLRELLGDATEPAKILLRLVKDWDLLIDNKRDVDEFRVIAEIKKAEKLLTEIDNALNHKP